VSAPRDIPPRDDAIPPGEAIAPREAIPPREAILLGVINLSPESMVEESIARSPAEAALRARQLIGAGVSILDVGARSITPDAPMVDDREEARRLARVLPGLVSAGYRVSVDTWSPDTAIRALQGGARMINFTGESPPARLLDAIATAGATLALTYMPYGNAYEMRSRDPVAYRIPAILERLAPPVERARAAGIREVVVDPNLGIIHPRVDDTEKIHLQLEVLDGLDRLRALGCPILLYAARKPERLARIMMASAVLRARPDYIRTHEPEILAALRDAARRSAE